MDGWQILVTSCVVNVLVLVVIVTVFAGQSSKSVFNYCLDASMCSSNSIISSSSRSRSGNNNRSIWDSGVSYSWAIRIVVVAIYVVVAASVESVVSVVIVIKVLCMGNVSFG